MISKDERKRRRAIVQGQRAEEATRQIAEMPIGLPQLGRLFDEFNAVLGEEPCDHSLRHTRQILRAQGESPESVIPWLAEFGGYCDCEVLGNVEEAWRRA